MGEGLANDHDNNQDSEDGSETCNDNFGGNPNNDDKD